MVIKQVLLDDIIEYLDKDIIKLYGNTTNKIVDNITNVDRINENSLDWVNSNKTNKQEIAETSKAKALLVDKTVEYSESMILKDKVLIVVKNPKLSLMSVIKHFYYEKPIAIIDPSAFVHPEAIIGQNVYVGPNCYIGKCVIGDNNIIHSNVCIYDRTTIGVNNVIHSGALICVDGLGCMRQENGQLEEFPQIGGVVIGNNCYIGGNTHIASGSLSDTIIENGCKINGMCFIGSNDILHENVWITGSTMLAGSVEVGRNSTIFSRVVVRDWCKIGVGVTIGMGSVVTKNVPDGETWVGNPARKLEKKA